MQYSFDPPTADEFEALYAQTGWGNWPRERFERALRGSWVICTARDGEGALVGMGRLISDGALHAFLTEMIVASDARGAGIGGTILSHLVEEARHRGVEDVELFAASGRTAFYERHGFVRRPEDRPGMQRRTARE